MANNGIYYKCKQKLLTRTVEYLSQVSRKHSSIGIMNINIILKLDHEMVLGCRN